MSISNPKSHCRVLVALIAFACVMTWIETSLAQETRVHVLEDQIGRKLTEIELERVKLVEHFKLNTYYRFEASEDERESEIDWLARNIYDEARGESREGWKMVGDVTLNRVRSGKYPNTVKGVVTQKKWSQAARGDVCQFTWFCDKKRHGLRTEKDFRVFGEIRELAEAMLLYDEWGTTADTLEEKDPLHYYNPDKANPFWARGKKRRKIGNHAIVYNVD